MTFFIVVVIAIALAAAYKLVVPRKTIDKRHHF
jgi:hypothetical protein